MDLEQRIENNNVELETPENQYNNLLIVEFVLGGSQQDIIGQGLTKVYMNEGIKEVTRKSVEQIYQEVLGSEQIQEEDTKKKEELQIYNQKAKSTGKKIYLLNGLHEAGSSRLKKYIQNIELEDGTEIKYARFNVIAAEEGGYINKD